jgi:hypothetical protein
LLIILPLKAILHVLFFFLSRLSIMLDRIVAAGVKAITFNDSFYDEKKSL